MICELNKSQNKKYWCWAV